MKKHRNILLGGIYYRCNVVYAPYLDRLEILKLQSLELRHLICDLSMCFYKLKDCKDCNIKGYLVLNRSQNRGHHYKLLYTYSRLDLRKVFFAKRIIKEWNIHMLPEKNYFN